MTAIRIQTCGPTFNAKKENRTPQEAGFALARRPFAPTDGFRLTLGRLEPGWEDYLT